MKILLFGKNGQIGWELQRALAPLGELVALDHRSAGAGADLSQPDRLVETVRSLRPDVIVNAAAYTAVDRAESEQALAEIINAQSPAVLAAEAASLGAWLVQYGTDYVYGGSGSTPRDEAAPVGPLSVYGRTKLAGEEGVRASGCRHLILRTSWVHAARGANFVRTILRLAAERESLSVVDDQVGAPTGADLVADVTAHALRACLAEPRLGGTYHVAAAGETSWFGVASFAIDWARARGLPLKLEPQALRPIPTSAYPTAARRPLNSRLDTRKLREAFGLVLPPWQAGVERMLTEVYTK